MLKRIWNAEPSLIVGLASAILSVAISFGLEITPEQNAAIAGLILATAVVIRQFVSPASAPVAKDKTPADGK